MATELCDTYKHTHPINKGMSQIDRTSLIRLKNELGEVMDSLKKVYNPEKTVMLANMKDMKYKPEGVSDVAWVYAKYCLLNEEKNDPKLREDCNMLLYAQNAAKEAMDSVWFAQQNIAVPLGCPPVTRSGSRTFTKIVDGQRKTDTFMDKDFYEMDKAVFKSFTDELKDRNLI